MDAQQELMDECTIVRVLARLEDGPQAESNEAGNLMVPFDFRVRPFDSFVQK